MQVPVQLHDIRAIRFRMLDGYHIAQSVWVVDTLGYGYHYDLCLITLVADRGGLVELSMPSGILEEIIVASSFSWFSTKDHDMVFCMFTAWMKVAWKHPYGWICFFNLISNLNLNFNRKTILLFLSFVQTVHSKTFTQHRTKSFSKTSFPKYAAQLIPKLILNLA